MKNNVDLVIDAAAPVDHDVWAFDRIPFLDVLDDWQSDEIVCSSTALVSGEKDERTQSGDEWELLSDAASVVSLATAATLTYADIAKRTAIPGNDLTVLPNEKSEFRVTTSHNQIKKNVMRKAGAGSSSMRNTLVMDDYFCMEGVKCARGGKSALMFKGNSKTNKQKKKRVGRINKNRF